MQSLELTGKRPVAATRSGHRTAVPATVPLEFSLAHLTMLAISPPELIEIAARAGYDFVSLRPIALGVPNEPQHPLATDPVLRRRTRAALAATGVKLLDIELARLHTEVDVRSYLPAMEVAAELGARHVLSSAWCADRALVQQQFAQLCELARPLGLTVDFEFVTFTDYRGLADAVELLSATQCDNAGICVDTLHFDRSGCRPADLDGLPREWFHYAQICDGPAVYGRSDAALKQVAREGRLYLGEGGIDVAGILSHLPPMPYSIELPNARRLAELGPEEFARRCLMSAKQNLAALRWPAITA
jgi:sugar phosphate isomerase/epimerase